MHKNILLLLFVILQQIKYYLFNCTKNFSCACSCYYQVYKLVQPTCSEERITCILTAGEGVGTWWVGMWGDPLNKMALQLDSEDR